MIVAHVRLFFRYYWLGAEGDKCRDPLEPLLAGLIGQVRQGKAPIRLLPEFWLFNTMTEFVRTVPLIDDLG